MSAIPKKVTGNANVQKLRVILLLEVDFNAIYKIIFNGRLILSIEREAVISIEVIGDRRTQSAKHLVLNKKLITNIANARKVPTITICANVMNYYDRVAHPFASLCA